jgi:adenosine deaminase
MATIKRSPVPRRNPAFYQAIPKVELHRHLEGSLRLTTMLEVGRAHGLEMPGTGQLRSLVQITSEEPYTFENFLSKFETLRLFYRSPEVISRITREAIGDAAKDGIRYMELRFTPVALSRAQGFPLAQVIDWVCEGTTLAQQETGVRVGLILSMNRHESLSMAEEIARLAVDYRCAGVVGLDLAGNEANFSALPFAGIFREARQAGLRATIHAGEWAGAPNVAEAILQLGADRIGHGVRVLEDAHTVELARERGTTFEVCITSNYQSGVVPALSDHPLTRMLSAGLNVTINTDDPSISQITLSEEYRLACENLGLPLETLQERILAAAQASFLPPKERDELVQFFQQQLRIWEKTDPAA